MIDSKAKYFTINFFSQMFNIPTEILIRSHMQLAIFDGRNKAF